MELTISWYEAFCAGLFGALGTSAIGLAVVVVTGLFTGLLAIVFGVNIKRK